MDLSSDSVPDEELLDALAGLYLRLERSTISLPDDEAALLNRHAWGLYSWH